MNPFQNLLNHIWQNDLVYKKQEPLPPQTPRVVPPIVAPTESTGTTPQTVDTKTFFPASGPEFAPQQTLPGSTPQVNLPPQVIPNFTAPTAPQVPTQPVAPVQPTIPTQQKQGTYQVPDRGLQVSDRDLEVLARILYGEVGNRPDGKRQLEARTITNVALNRLKNGSWGDSLEKVLTKPRQFQAYDPDNKNPVLKGRKSQYNQYGTEGANKIKQKEIDDIIEEIRKGDFKDTLEGRQYYVHTKDDTILATRAHNPKNAK